MKNFYDTKDAMCLLELSSIRTAQNRIKTMNDALLNLGYWVEPGKVPVFFFHEKYPYIEKQAE